MGIEPTTAGPRSAAPRAQQHACASRGPLHPESPEACELLESLDDAMFTAIAGDAASSADARELWRAATRRLPAELVAESREQYLRFAVETLRRTQNAEVRDPAVTMVALELVAFLSNEW